MVKKQGRKKTGPDSIGRQITESLSKEQVLQLLGVTFSTLDQKAREQIYGALDDDIEECLRRVISPSGRTPAQSQTAKLKSTKKIVEMWNEMWGELDSIIFNIGDEEGPYIIQDHHWESPYFDGSSAASDVEIIAVNMRELVDAAFKLVPEKGFCPFLEEIGSAILCLPDWMGASENEGLALEKNATYLVLRWEWLACLQEGKPASSFVESIAAMEKEISPVYLDGGALTDFITALDRRDMQEIFENISKRRAQPPWSDVLDSPYSHWFGIYQILCSQFEPDEYLRSCKEKILENWELATPVIKDHIKKKQYSEAEEVVIQALGAALRSDGHWEPERSLLIEQRMNYHDNSTLIELIELWARVASHLGQDERKAALKIQTITLRKWNDWNRVIKAFNEIGDGASSETFERLFEQWKSIVVEKSEYRAWNSEKPKGEHWGRWLIESKLDCDKSRSYFLDKVRSWLKRLSNCPEDFVQEHRRLALLTSDLTSGTKFKNRYPRFHSVVLGEISQTDRNSKSRRSWLKELDVGELLEEAMACWREQLVHGVPDPASVYKSCYDWHASWLGALMELNPGVYKGTIEKWQTLHRRRRNLWAAIAEEGLPVD